MGKVESVHSHDAIIQKMKDIMHYSEILIDGEFFILLSIRIKSQRKIKELLPRDN